MNVDKHLERLSRHFATTFPYFIKKDYCESDWSDFYQSLKDYNIVTVAHDGGFYFRNHDDYLLALLLK
ncbi:MAG: hypothetical protein M0R77_18915 [Gammaproteobacteria bacterium]|nr:hypothetical protein [Gammaproteobacteria bacterium]